jgi:hypothetical protein
MCVCVCVCMFVTSAFEPRACTCFLHAYDAPSCSSTLHMCATYVRMYIAAKCLFSNSIHTHSHLPPNTFVSNFLHLFPHFLHLPLHLLSMFSTGNIRMSTCRDAYMHICACLYVDRRMSVCCMYVCTYVCMYVCIYIYIYITYDTHI